MKFTRTKKEIIKYINKEIKIYKGLNDIQGTSTRAIYVLQEMKRFMTEKTDWLEI